MSVIFIVVPLAALIVLAAVIAFVASARRGQFDDLDTPPVRMLNDDSERQVAPSRERVSRN
ncbi:MAG TPA: cbb3-type cytochrome oxidase assembly protein CcoS [Gemmatimonadaceae bacterium]|nr:cbb3-type cytochrome oxidase assembly protein CcoS [Gemmatimonadaceae bacterium]